MVHKSDLMMALGEITILDPKIFPGFFRKHCLLMMVFFFVLIKSLFVLGMLYITILSRYIPSFSL